MVTVLCSPLFCLPVAATALALLWGGLFLHAVIRRTRPHLIPLLAPLRAAWLAAGLAVAVLAAGWASTLKRQAIPAGVFTYLPCWATAADRALLEREAVAFMWRNPRVLVTVRDAGGPRQLLNALGGEGKPVVVSPGDRGFYAPLLRRLAARSRRPATAADRAELWESPLVIVAKRSRFGAFRPLTTDDKPWHTLQERFAADGPPLRVGVPDPATTADGWLVLRALADEFGPTRARAEAAQLWAPAGGAGLVRLTGPAATPARALETLRRGDARLSAVVCSESAAIPFYLAHPDRFDLIYPPRIAAIVGGAYVLPDRRHSPAQVMAGREFLRFLAGRETGRVSFYRRRFRAKAPEWHPAAREPLGGGLSPLAKAYTPPQTRVLVWTPSATVSDAERGYAQVTGLLATLPPRPRPVVTSR